jgi:hypothetical protein
MSKRFQENALWILKSVYYMKEPESITKGITRRMSSEEIARVMFYLRNKGLINFNEEEKWPFHVNLTDKGIEFIVNELDRKNQNEFNKIVALTGAIVALIGIYTFLKDLELINETNFWISYIFVGFTVACIAPIATFIFKYYFMED